MTRWVSGKKITNQATLSLLSDTLNYTGHCGCIYLLYLSMFGRLISSQNRTSHLFICMGDRTTPFGVRLYSQYWSNVFSSSSGVVALEKFRPTTCQGEKKHHSKLPIHCKYLKHYLKINDNSYTTLQKMHYCTCRKSQFLYIYILKSLFQNISQAGRFHQIVQVNFAKIFTSISGSDLRALNKVMVLPDPGGPHRTKGLCSASQVYSRASCLTVSTVGITTSGAATLCVSTSTTGTFEVHGIHSPEIDTCWQETYFKLFQNLNIYLNILNSLPTF